MNLKWLWQIVTAVASDGHSNHAFWNLSIELTLEHFFAAEKCEQGSKDLAHSSFADNKMRDCFGVYLMTHYKLVKTFRPIGRYCPSRCCASTASQKFLKWNLKFPRKIISIWFWKDFFGLRITCVAFLCQSIRKRRCFNAIFLFAQAESFFLFKDKLIQVSNRSCANNTFEVSCLRC